MAHFPSTAAWFLGSLLTASLFLTGCRSTNSVLYQYENQIGLGNYPAAAESVLATAEKEDADQLLWRLLAGNAYLLAGDAESSTAQLDLAEDLFADNDATSVMAAGAQQAKAILGNELSFPYRGFGQDRLFCCLYKGLAYATLGNVAATRTELNRAAQHQENWLFDRRREIAAAEEKLEQAVAVQSAEASDEVDPMGQQAVFLGDRDFAQSLRENTGFDLASSGDLSRLATSDYTNVYLNHFCGVFRWLQGDGGREFLRDAAALAPQSTVLQRDWREIDGGVRPRNQVWLYVEDGLCVERVEWRVDLPLFLLPGLGRYALYAGMAFPRLVERSAAAEQYWVKADGGQTPLELLENMDRLVRTEYDVYMRGAVKREIVRTLAKVSAQVALQIAAQNCDDSGARFALKMAQVGMAAWAASSTKADLREWVSLPKVIWVGHVPRPQDGRLVLSARLGGQEQNLELALPEGNSIVWVRKVNGAVPMTARVVTYPNP
ncbi:MAG: hypothetical protein ACI4SG_05155 [Oligosphaeraceae bacterium]